MPRDDSAPPDAVTLPQAEGPRWNRHTAEAVRGAIEPLALPAKSAFDPSTDRFAIGGELGRGGMGRVMAATDTTLDRAVAIKQALGADAENLARFEREVRITARLEHPSIVPVHDAGRDARGQPYYIMRRIEGEPLSDRVANAGVRGRLALVPNVLAAVDAAAFAHARKVIHRDIKPWNILVGSYGETLLIDWGLARDLEENDPPSRASNMGGDHTLTRIGHAYGTPGYMAPEQARGERGDARADVYALGATLFHVLAGKPAVVAASAQAWLDRAAAGDPIALPVDEIPDDVPRELVAVVIKATASAPSERYADAGALAADLRAFLAGQLVAAHRYTTRERLVRWVRRHRIAVATAVIAVVALGVIGVVAIVNVVDERDAAAAARAEATGRAEAMLLERASMLAPRDPARAVALLRELAPASRHHQRARDIAAVAAANGIARGKAAHRGVVTALAIAPDGKRLVSGGTDGELQLHDLVAGTSRTLARGRPVVQVAWTDGGETITYSTRDGLRHLDVASGSDVALARGVSWFWKAAEDRVRYLRDEILAEQSTRPGAAERTLAREVSRAVGAGDVALVDGNGHLRIVDAAGERLLVAHSAAPKDVAHQMTISDDATRVAALIDGDLVEWDVASGTALRRWPNRRANHMFYAGSRLYLHAGGTTGAIDELLDDRVLEVARGTFSILVQATTANGRAFAGNDGTFGMLVDGLPFRYQHDPMPVRSIAGDPATSIFALGLTDGSIRWWDARTFVPRVLPLPARATLCAVGRDSVYASRGTSIIAVPRSGGPAREIADGMYQGCAGAAGSRVAVLGMGRQFTDVFDGDKPTRVDGMVILDADEDRVYFASDERTISEITPAGDVVRVRAPGDMLGFSTSRGWLGATTRDGRILRVDRAGTQTSIANPHEVDRMAISGTGTVWFTSARDVYRWATGAIEHIGTLSSEPLELAGLVDGSAALRVRDGAVWRAAANGLAMRNPAAHGDRWVSFGGRAVATIDAGHELGTHYLDTNERMSRRAPSLSAVAMLADHDRTMVVQTAGVARYVMLYEDGGPADPMALQAWIDRVTNAAVARDGDVLTWR